MRGGGALASLQTVRQTPAASSVQLESSVCPASRPSGQPRTVVRAGLGGPSSQLSAPSVADVSSARWGPRRGGGYGEGGLTGPGQRCQAEVRPCAAAPCPCRPNAARRVRDRVAVAPFRPSPPGTRQCDARLQCTGWRYMLPFLTAGSRGRHRRWIPDNNPPAVVRTGTQMLFVFSSGHVWPLTRVPTATTDTGAPQPPAPPPPPPPLLSLPVYEGRARFCESAPMRVQCPLQPTPQGHRTSQGSVCLWTPFDSPVAVGRGHVVSQTRVLQCCLCMESTGLWCVDFHRLSSGALPLVSGLRRGSSRRSAPEPGTGCGSARRSPSGGSCAVPVRFLRGFGTALSRAASGQPSAARVTCSPPGGPNSSGCRKPKNDTGVDKHLADSQLVRRRQPA